MFLHLYVLAFAFAEGAQIGSPYKDQSLSSMEPNPYEGKSGRKPNAETQANYFKLRLLECVAGLDRGFAANAYAAMQVESAALALTEQSEPVMLSWTSGAAPSLLKQQMFMTLSDTIYCPTSTSAAVAMAMTVSIVLSIHVRFCIIASLHQRMQWACTYRMRQQHAPYHQGAQQKTHGHT